MSFSSYVVVAKDNKHAVKLSSESQLTLITCYPFSFTGDAPYRYIITAKLKE
ncbi:sortase [Ammoniphilus sp. 3BR4]|uniref:sortase domain-containing protein n=1 Tax=Ammoniphilus sp. 3BR4 TaxID=3158265 RepID=UPI003465429B